MTTATVATDTIKLDQLHPNPNQPRKFFDPQAIEDLKESLAHQGLINPISVVKNAEGFIIIAGERRFRAAQELKWDSIECRVWPSETTPQDLELLSLVENIQRKDLKPTETADAFKLLTDAPYNMTQGQVALQTGFSRTTIAQYLMIAGLDPQVKESVKRLTNLEFGLLLQICRLKTPEDQMELAKKASDGDWTVKQLTSEVDKKLGVSRSPSASSAPKDPSSPNAESPVYSGGAQDFTFTAKGKRFTIVTTPPSMDILDVYCQNFRCAIIDYMGAQKKEAEATSN